MNELPLANAFLLVEPGPVTLVTTAVGRRKNVMTIAVTSQRPPSQFRM